MAGNVYELLKSPDLRYFDTESKFEEINLYPSSYYTVNFNLQDDFYLGQTEKKRKRKRRKK